MFNIFSSFVSVNYFNFDLKKLKKQILEFKFKNDSVSKSSYGGWQSNRFKKIPKNFTELFNKINIDVQKIEKNLFLSKKLKLKDLWYNVNSLGSFNRPHYHYGDVISGVYYISIPENSGSIVFINKDLDNFYTSINKYNEYNSSNWTIAPEENKCILFPSYLKHYVEPNLNKKERISISFNYGF